MAGRHAIERPAAAPGWSSDEIAAARDLDLDVHGMRDLARFGWIARELAGAPLPHGWSCERGLDGSRCFALKGRLRKAHPLLDVFRGVLEAVREREELNEFLAVAVGALCRTCRRLWGDSELASWVFGQIGQAHRAMEQVQPDQVLEMARYMHIDEIEERELTWVALWAVPFTLPPDWEEWEDDRGRPYYYHRGTRVSTYDHPLDAFFARLLEGERTELARARAREKATGPVTRLRQRSAVAGGQGLLPFFDEQRRVYFADILAPERRVYFSDACDMHQRAARTIQRAVRRRSQRARAAQAPELPKRLDSPGFSCGESVPYHAPSESHDVRLPPGLAVRASVPELHGSFRSTSPSEDPRAAVSASYSEEGTSLRDPAGPRGRDGGRAPPAISVPAAAPADVVPAQSGRPGTSGSGQVDDATSSPRRSSSVAPTEHLDAVLAPTAVVRHAAFGEVPRPRTAGWGDLGEAGGGKPTRVAWQTAREESGCSEGSGCGSGSSGSIEVEASSEAASRAWAGPAPGSATALRLACMVAVRWRLFRARQEEMWAGMMERFRHGMAARIQAAWRGYRQNRAWRLVRGSADDLRRARQRRGVPGGVTPADLRRLMLQVQRTMVRRSPREHSAAVTLQAAARRWLARRRRQRLAHVREERRELLKRFEAAYRWMYRFPQVPLDARAPEELGAKQPLHVRQWYWLVSRAARIDVGPGLSGDLRAEEAINKRLQRRLDRLLHLAAQRRRDREGLEGQLRVLLALAEAGRDQAVVLARMPGRGKDLWLAEELLATLRGTGAQLLADLEADDMRLCNVMSRAKSRLVQAWDGCRASAEFRRRSGLLQLPPSARSLAALVDATVRLGELEGHLRPLEEAFAARRALLGEAGALERAVAASRQGLQMARELRRGGGARDDEVAGIEAGALGAVAATEAQAGGWDTLEGRAKATLVRVKRAMEALQSRALPMPWDDVRRLAGVPELADLGRDLARVREAIAAARAVQGRPEPVPPAAPTPSTKALMAPMARDRRRDAGRGDMPPPSPREPWSPGWVRRPASDAAAPGGGRDARRDAGQAPSLASWQGSALEPAQMPPWCSPMADRRGSAPDAGPWPSTPGARRGLFLPSISRTARGPGPAPLDRKAADKTRCSPPGTASTASSLPVSVAGVRG